LREKLFRGIQSANSYMRGTLHTLTSNCD